MLTMSGGQSDIPIVFVVPMVLLTIGSDSPMPLSLLRQLSGLKLQFQVLRDAKGLLKTAIRDDNIPFWSVTPHNSTGPLRIGG
jgi:pyruvate/2-oxoglutarate/acetoin dehydrogenase E1 component